MSTARKLYALLVGIDQYPAGTKSLQGCGNDIQFFFDYLKGRVETEQFTFLPKVLFDQDATRQAVIAGFRQHLSQAGPQDVALFYYSGHGSQEYAPEEFWPIEPDRLNETLVCYDSRLPGGHDLADKELSQLIAAVAARAGHFLVVLDCCHSGSGTRIGEPPREGVRQIPVDTRPRPIESYEYLPERVLAAYEGLAPAAERSSGWQMLPQGRHVLLAACQDRQTAKEYAADELHWGAFSYFLRRALEQANGVLTYRDLFKQAQARVRASVRDQSPQLEAVQAADLDLPFLGGALQPRPQYFTVSHTGSAWRLDAGSIHGIPAPAGGETPCLALFALDTPANELCDLTKALGEAQVSQVGPDSSLVEDISFAADQALTYKAVFTSLPMPPLGVLLVGESTGLGLVRAALAHSAPGGGPSLYVREETQAPGLWLVSTGSEYWITNPNDVKLLTPPLQGIDEPNARQAVQYLEHIARWKRTVELANPASVLPADAVRLEIVAEGGQAGAAEMEAGITRVQYALVNGQWKKPTYTVRLANQCDQVLYCTVLGLWESYGIDVALDMHLLVRLEPGQEFSTRLTASVPEEVWKQGITDRQDVLKLIACTAEFDPLLLTQGALGSARRTQRSVRRGAASTLNRLMQHIQTREASEQTDETTYADWITAQAVVIVHRPLETQPVPRSGEGAFLGAGVTLEPHPALAAQACLGNLPPSNREADGVLLPALFNRAQPELLPFNFRLTRSGGLGDDLLELRQVENPEVVTAEQPLCLSLSTPLKAGEHVLAYGYDGEFYLPLGVARAQGRQTRFDLSRLPVPTSQGERDLAGAVRILFQKLVTHPLGLPYPYPILAAVETAAGGELHYEAEVERVRERVAAAQTINLYVHGMFGDSRGLAASAALTGSPDLALAFDYESVNTGVEEIARSLKQRLEMVGLASGHGKKLRVIAHSLGGLVARWWIEREGGAQVVERLVTCGSPHGGLHWATVQQWATVALSLGLNGLAVGAWPAGALGFLLMALEKLDVSLDQISPQADLIQALNDSPDPHVPYTLIAGDTSLLPAALAGEGDSKLSRLLQRLGYRAFDLGFLGQPNDIAVSLHSAQAVLAARRPRPQLVTIASDHLSFFNAPLGQQALAQELS